MVHKCNAPLGLEITELRCVALVLGEDLSVACLRGLGMICGCGPNLFSWDGGAWN